jgi:hypothetical protein
MYRYNIQLRRTAVLVPRTKCLALVSYAQSAPPPNHQKVLSLPTRDLFRSSVTLVPSTLAQAAVKHDLQTQPHLRLHESQSNTTPNFKQIYKRCPRNAALYNLKTFCTSETSTHPHPPSSRHGKTKPTTLATPRGCPEENFLCLACVKTQHCARETDHILNMSVCPANERARHLVFAMQDDACVASASARHNAVVTTTVIVTACMHALR